MNSTHCAYYKDTKSRPCAPHVSHHKRVEKKVKRMGVAAEKAFVRPVMRCGVQHFTV